MLIVSLVILQVIIFSALIFILRRVMSTNVVSATRHLEDMNREYLKKEEELNKRFEELKQQSQDIMNNSQEEARKIKADALKDAESVKNQIVEEARKQSDVMIQQADNARLALLGELDQKINERAVFKASDILIESLPESIRLEIHRRWVEDLIARSFQSLDMARLSPGVNEATVVAAFELNPEQRGALTARIRERLGREIQLKEKTDPGIVAGLVVTIGDLFLDGSLRFKIQEAARALRQNK